MLQEIMVSLGGRIAEELIFDDITTGASQDIKQATQMAKRHGNQVRHVRARLAWSAMTTTIMKSSSAATSAHTKGYGENVAQPRSIWK